MKRVVVLLACLFASLIFMLQVSSANESVVPDIELSGNLTPEDEAYLGLPEGVDHFRLTDIDSDLILLQIFSIYCPLCQRDAHEFDALRKALSKEGGSKVLILGVGAGNSLREVEAFRKEFSVGVPLLPDAEYTIHRLLGNVGTPFYMLLRRNGEGTFDVLFSQEGAIGKDVKSFAQGVLVKAGELAE